MKLPIVILLVLLGLYWLLAHTAPFPFNHEQFGLYNHTFHGVIGIFLIIGAILTAWIWKEKVK